jgi:F-type H+-transporting ATPase subunit a
MENVFPQVVFAPFGIPIRDSVISTWVMIALVVGAVILARERWPTILEMLVGFLNDIISDVMGQSAEPFLPFLGALIIFIAGANVLGVLPAIPVPDELQGILPWLPLETDKMLPIVTPTRDINTPLALAIAVFFAVHYFGVRGKGALGYLKSLSSPIFMLPLEIIGQLSRTLSLTLRLFGNVISTELIVAVIFMLIPLFVPLILMGFSMFTGVLQAYIFTSLAAAYIGAALEEIE